MLVMMNVMCMEASSRFLAKIHKLIAKKEEENEEIIALSELKKLREEVLDEVLSPEGIVAKVITQLGNTKETLN